MFENQEFKNVGRKIQDFYFLRHGETDWNVLGLITGKTDRILTPLGREQAKEVGKYLKLNRTRIPFQTMLSSTLSRAIQTAEIINQDIDLPFFHLQEFCEVSFGVLEGTPYLSKEKEAAFYSGERIAHAAETIQELDLRVSVGLEKTLSYPQPLMIVSHGGVFKAFMRVLQTNVIPSIQNCRLYRFYRENLSSDTQLVKWQVEEVL